MSHGILANAAIGGGLLIGLAFVSLVLLCAVILVESFVLRLLHWGDYAWALWGSLLANAASTVAGIALIVVFPFLSHDRLEFFLVALAVSIVLEGGVLQSVRRQTPSRTWGAAAIANSVSYLMLATGAILLAS